MAKGELNGTAVHAEAPVVGLRGLMRKALKRPVDQVSLPDLGSTLKGRPRHPLRDDDLPKLLDLSGRPKLLIFKGPGSAGKTTNANFLCSQLDAKGMLLGNALIAATDPGVKALPFFLPDGAVHQPEGNTAEAELDLTRKVLAEVDSEDPPPVTILDAGGGSNALEQVVEKDKSLFARIEQRGVAVILLWHWTPRVLDLALLKRWRALEVRPTGTVMVLNGAYARDSWDPYETLRAQGVYQRTLMDGQTAEVWMPALEQEVALEVERKGLLFSYARHGKVPVWKAGTAAVEGDAATEVGLWTEDAVAEWSPVGSWVTP